MGPRQGQEVAKLGVCLIILEQRMGFQVSYRTNQDFPPFFPVMVMASIIPKLKQHKSEFGQGFRCGPELIRWAKVEVNLGRSLR